MTTILATRYILSLSSRHHIMVYGVSASNCVWILLVSAHSMKTQTLVITSPKYTSNSTTPTLRDFDDEERVYLYNELFTMKKGPDHQLNINHSWNSILISMPSTYVWRSTQVNDCHFKTETAIYKKWFSMPYNENIIIKIHFEMLVVDRVDNSLHWIT